MTIQIPLSALSPESAHEGAPIDLTATGQITSLEGDTAIIHLTSTNGCPITSTENLDEPALLKRAREEDGETED
jgi:hypothetical protein